MTYRSLISHPTSLFRASAIPRSAFKGDGVRISNIFLCLLFVPPLPDVPSWSSCLPTASHRVFWVHIPCSMSDTCIVCLGDLGGGATPSPVAAASPRNHQHGEDSPPDFEITPPAVRGDENSGQIAHLLPCGHNLHHNCLKPWVERANSCPICRQNFNVVELSDTPGGRSSALCEIFHPSLGTI